MSAAADDYTDSSELPAANQGSPITPLPLSETAAIPEVEDPMETETDTKDSDDDSETEDSDEDDESETYTDDDEYDLNESPEIAQKFEQCYTCCTLSGTGKDHLEQGGQIILPGSTLEELLERDVSYPMLFEIRNESKEKVSHCGVSEFTAEEGKVMMPGWMMQNLKLEAGEVVKLKNVSTLEKCTFAKLQPHSVEFWGLRDMKTVLEEVLGAKFFCLTTGDTISFEYRSRKFFMDVLETKPAPAVCILDTDFEVDFAVPLDYKEPRVEDEQKQEKGRGVFVPFSGVARRLNGETNSAAMAKEKAVEVREEVKKQKKQNQQFEPFTGKKYTLAG
ncbi:Ubiquitin recognition factor in ER-associated degradation protein 1 [Linum perenne]